MYSTVFAGSMYVCMYNVLDADVACSEGKESLNNFRSLVKALKVNNLQHSHFHMVFRKILGHENI